uniref:ARAD1D17600p n=1 Tax=Blastobotrys adeninivorans TaxID=409370 RepID=A0A060TEW9_BLAAD
MQDVEKTPTINTLQGDDMIKEDAVVETVKVSRLQRWKDSFKPMDLSYTDGGDWTDVERAAMATAKSPLERGLKSRHLQMIAIGGAIGTGLFVGSGETLRTGGPAGLIIGFGIIGIMLYCTVQALGELAVTFPVAGAFSTYATRFIDPAWGFALGWNYGVQWLVVLPLELVAASITIGFWQSDINPAAWVCIFYVIVVVINLFGVRGYGEAEFVFSTIKVLAVIGFIILGIIINCGGGPEGGYIGAKYWYNPGAFSNGFKGVCSVFVNAAFSFTGTELVGLAAAETDNPRKSLPSATKQVFWRICLFYMVSLTLVGLLVPYDDDQLMGSSNVDITASPFVIAIKNAGIKVLPSIFNVVIMIAVLSVGNSAVYGCSRTLASLSAQRLAPKWLGYIDRQGRPLAGIAVTCVFGLLCFLSASDKQQEVFNWLMALTGLSLIFTWGTVCLCHIRFRRAMKMQGRSLDELAFTSQVGVIGSWIGLVINCLVLVAQFWIALFPVGASPDPAVFFQKYLAAPIVIVFYIIWKLYKRPPFVRTKDIDVDTGRRDIDLERVKLEIAEEKARIKAKGWLYRTYKFWC